MNILIIDDQKSVTDGILDGVRWERLGSPQVIAVNTPLKAREIVLTCRIDIAVCDIEMPFEDGLQLFGWIREVSPDTEGIFLTSHAVFDYAQEAIRLGCSEYLVQPIRYEALENALLRLISNMSHKGSQRGLAQIGTAVLENRDVLVRHFWSDLLLTQTPKSPQQTAENLILLGIPADMRVQYRPMLFTVLEEEISLLCWNQEETMDKIIRLFCRCGKLTYGDGNEFFINLDATHLLVIEREIDAKLVGQFVKMCLDACRQSLSVNIRCTLGRPNLLTELYTQIPMLLQSDQNGYADSRQIIWLEESPAMPELSGTLMEDAEEWIGLFAYGNQEALRSKFRQQRPVGNDALFLLHQQIMQTFLSSLLLRQIPVNDIYRDENYLALYIRALRSARDLNTWFEALLSYNETLPKLPGINTGHALISQLKKYIADNLDHELSRKELADSVYLSESYVSHLWSKETGMSLTEYVISQKIDLAKRLLATTQLPVSLIAMKAGYSNFSYFSKIFKKRTELTPIEYRKNAAEPHR